MFSEKKPNPMEIEWLFNFWFYILNKTLVISLSLFNLFKINILKYSLFKEVPLLNIFYSHQE